MSSTGVRDSNSNDKRIIKGLILNEAQFIQSLRVFANTSTLSGLGSTEGEINNSPTQASGNYLSRLGDTMLGPLALSPPLDFRIVIDANNTIDIGPLNDNSQYTSNVQLDSIQPNGFVLDIIANAAFDGQLLVLRTFAPTTPFTISQGTLGNGGNIQTGDGNDLTVGDLQTVTLIFDEALKIEANTGGSWRVLSVSSATGGGTTLPVVDTTPIVKGSVDATKLMRFEVDGFTTGVTRIMTPPNADALLAGLNLSQTWTALNTYEGGIQISDSSSNIHGLLQGITSTGVRLSLTAGESFSIFDNITEIFRMNNSIGLQLIGNDLIMGNGGNVVAGGSGEGMTNIGHLDFIDNQATPAAAISLYSDGTDLFANTGGGVKNLSDIGGEFFGPWTANHNAGNFALNNVSSLQIVDSVGGVHGLFQGLASTGVRLSLTAGESFSIFDNITEIFRMNTAIGLSLLNNNLVMGTGTIIAGGATKQINNVGEVAFVNNTASPAGNGIFFFDGTDLKAKTGGSTVNLTDIGGSNFTDATFRVTDELDLTKKFAVDVGTNSPGATATLLFGASSNITLSFPNATTIIPGLSTVQTFTATNTFSNNIVAGGAGNGMSNIGNLRFVDNAATPVGLALYSDGTDIFANTSTGVKNLKDIGTGGGSQTPWLSNIDAAGFSLDDLLSLSIEDSVGSTKLSISGPLGLGVRFSFVSGDSVFFTENITNRLEIDSTGIKLLNNNITMGTGEIIAGGAGKEIRNIGELVFVNNTLTPAGNGIFFFDGTDLKAKTGSTTVNLTDIGGGSSNDGIQESEPPLEDQTTQFNFQMFISNGKQGYEVSKTTTLTEDNIVFVPFYLGKRARVTHLGWVNIAAATGTITFAMAIYANRTDGQNYPGTLIVQDTSATVVASSQTALTNSLTPTNLEAGFYWIAIIPTNLQLGSIVTCARHDSTGANSAGYYDDDGNTDVMLSLLGFTDAETSMPSTAANDMTPIVENPPALFARFIPNTS